MPGLFNFAGAIARFSLDRDLHFTSTDDIMKYVPRGGAARSARLAHNQQVAGSNPAPATKKTVPPWWGFFLGYEVG